MSKKAKGIIVIFVLLFTIILLGVVSYYFYTILATKDPKIIETDLSQTEEAKNFEDMVKYADYILIGSYEGLHSTVNLVRDKEDATKESTEKYIGGKVFRFQIDEVLAGNIDEEMIKVIHRYSNPFDIEKTLGFLDEQVEDVDPTYMKPRYGKTYVLFLTESDINDMYIRSSEPFIISVDEENRVEIESSVMEELDFEDDISETNIAVLKEKIQALK